MTIAVETTKQTCPECDGAVREADAEAHCTQCGLVVDADQIDHGPEWIAYTSAERNEKKRVGSPRTERRHDKGLGGQIGIASSGDVEIHSNVEEWTRFDSKKTQNQAHLLGDVRRICDRLGLEGDLVDRACRLASEGHDADLAYGRSIEVVAAAAVLATCREHGLPVTASQLTEWADVNQSLLYQIYHEVVDESNVQPTLIEPVEFVPQLVSELELSPEVEQEARELALEAQADAIHVGRDPKGFAGSAVYAVGKRHEYWTTQPDVADAADVSVVTIRNNRDELQEAGLL